MLAKNPELADFEILDSDIDPATWRNVVLRMTKENGDSLDMVLLRGPEWLEDYSVEVGTTIELDLEEVGATGSADVLAVDPCPVIEDGPGRVVTGTFRHSACNLLDLRISGLDEPIGVTANHPIWSEDRDEFVEAKDLRFGESVLAADGSRERVISINLRFDSEPVFNLEIDIEHVYYVSHAGMLVHNACGRFTSGPYGIAGSGPSHHIATHYGSWGTKFKSLFKSANRSIHGKGNRVYLPGHSGPHTNAYHQKVYNRLSTKLRGVQGTANRATVLQSELNAISNDLLTGALKPN